MLMLAGIDNFVKYNNIIHRKYAPPLPATSTEHVFRQLTVHDNKAAADTTKCMETATPKVR